MAFFLNHFRSSNNDNDVELRDLESGSFNSSGVGGRPAYTSIYPAPPELDATCSMDMETSSEKRPRRLDQEEFPKVRIVPQTSRIPTVVSDSVT